MIHDARTSMQAGLGKVSQALFDRSILPFLGAKSSSVLVGPAQGIDFGLLSVGSGKVIAVATDPLFVLPELGWEKAAWLAIHIIASDVAVSGIPPQYMSISLNLPLEIDEGNLADLWQGIHRAAADAGISIITGHTGRYEGCAFPTIGSATIFGVGNEESFVTTAMAKPGDQILMTRCAALESTALISILCPNQVTRIGGAQGQTEGAALFPQLTCVFDAARIVGAGLRSEGITSMHDATERGVAGALVEMAMAADVGIYVAHDAIPVHATTRAIFNHFDADPIEASSAGTMLLTCVPEAAGRVNDICLRAGTSVARIGEVRPRTEGCTLQKENKIHSLVMPPTDPFWPMLTELRRLERGEI